MVGEFGQCGELAHLRCPLPLDPAVQLTGLIAEECSVFKSALSPLRLTFRVAGARTHCSLPVIGLAWKPSACSCKPSDERVPMSE